MDWGRTVLALLMQELAAHHARAGLWDWGQSWSREASSSLCGRRDLTNCQK